MKKIVLATPRSGSHAYCDLQLNNLSEVMNIEDMLLPRLSDNTIDFGICSKVFLDALNDTNFITSWYNRPSITNQHHMIGYDTNLSKIEITNQPSLNDIINEHYKRWCSISLLDNWCLKLMKYHGTPQYIVDQMLNQSDEVIILKRRDQLAQALSMTKATQSQLWHGYNLTGEVGDIDYDIFKKSLNDIVNNENWVNQYSGTNTYYEDLDLSNSKFNKNNVSLRYDITRCHQIMEETI
jgi:hypothetical protein|tara:strand:- start:2101 stop:2814 length:714 start_codon:yes stop_codon:yes gene_type:complete